MIIKGLRLKNYRCFEDVKISFPEDCQTIGFVGRNGAGKSSILEAIFIALYGLGPKGGKKAEIIRSGKNHSQIILTFEYGGETYEIERNFYRKESSVCELYLIKNGRRVKCLARRCEDISKWISENIGPPDVFRSAIYVQQNEITRILRNPQELARFFMLYLGLDRWSNASRNIGALSNYISQKIQLKNKELEGIKRQLSSSREKLEREIAGLNKLGSEIKSLREEVERIEGEFRRAEKIREYLELKERLKGKEREKEELEKILREWEDRLKELQEQVLELISLEKEGIEEKIERLKKIRDEIKTLEYEKKENESLLKNKKKELFERRQRREELIKLKEEILEQVSEIYSTSDLEELRRRIEGDLVKMKEYEEAIDYLERKFGRKFIEEALRRLEEETIDSLENEIKKLGKKAEEMRISKGKIFERMNNLRESIKKLQAGKGKCPLCEADLSEERKDYLIKKYSSEISKLQDELERTKRELSFIEGRKEELEVIRGILLRYGRTFEEGKRAKRNIEKMGGEAGSNEILRSLKVVSEIERLEDEIKELEGKIEELMESLNEIERRKEEISGKRSLEELEEELRELSNKEVRLKELRRKGVKEAARRVKEKLENTRRKIEEISKEIDEIRERAEAFKEELYMEGISPEGISIEEAKERAEELRKEMTKKREELSKKEGMRRKIEEFVKGLRDEIKKLEEDFKRCNEDLEKYRKLLSVVREIKEKMSKILTIATNNAILAVQELTNQIFQEFTEKDYIVRLIPKSSEGEEVLERLIVKVRYGELEEEMGGGGVSILSGGERVALALALRMAMAKVLSLTQRGGEELLLILDEPTVNLDEENRGRLSQMLEDYLRQLRQVIIVSHNPEILRSVEKTYRVVYEEERGASKILEYVEIEGGGKRCLSSTGILWKSWPSS